MARRAMRRMSRFAACAPQGSVYRTITVHQEEERQLETLTAIFAFGSHVTLTSIRLTLHATVEMHPPAAQ